MIINNFNIIFKKLSPSNIAYEIHDLETNDFLDFIDGFRTPRQAFKDAKKLTFQGAL